MTSQNRRVDRRAVFERDDFTCQGCASSADETDEQHGFDTYEIGLGLADGDGGGSSGDGDEHGDRDENETGVDRHVTTLVTLCADCRAVLEGPSDTGDAAGPDGLATPRALFELVRDFTATQGEAVSDVAAFADLGSSLPSSLVDGDIDRERYRRSRRTNVLALSLLEARLETLASTTATDTRSRFDLETDAAAALDTFREDAGQLQRDLQEIVATIELVAVALDRCHICLDAIGDVRRCPTCAAVRPTLETDSAAATWYDSAGELDFDELFRSISETLQRASATTDRVTESATDVAEALVGS